MDLLPVFIVFGILFVIGFIIIVIHCCKRSEESEHDSLVNIEANQPGKITVLTDSLINECCICLDQYNKGDTVRWLECGHYYHQRCIDEWFSKEKLCPICSGNNIK